MQSCRVKFDKNYFVCSTNYESREIPKKAGFRWNPNKLYWYTENLNVAYRLREYFDETAKSKISDITLNISSWSGMQPFYPSHLKLYPHQLEAIHFALNRNRSYLGLDAGLGKTIVAAIIANVFKGPVVYICPPFLMENTKNEFNKWAPDLSVYIYNKKFDPTANVLIVPDSLISKAFVEFAIEKFLENDRFKPALLFIDEAHRYKNSKAKRTQSLFGHKSKYGIVRLFKKIVYMSGTPMPNRPIELYPVLSSAAPETIDFKNEFDFALRYCAGHQNHFGWDFSGASNVQELAKKVVHPDGPFMLRLKKDILNLPPKLEEMLILNGKQTPMLMKMGVEILRRLSTEDLMKAQIAESIDLNEKELHLATYRRLLGIEKVEPAVEYIKSILEDTDESILIFAIHKDVIAGLTEGLREFNPLVITGENSATQRQTSVEVFQSDKTRRVFIGNIQACGVGFTLTKASRVIFVEFAWVPGDNSQASDRTHRIGQNKTVLVQYLVFKDSVDKAVIETLLVKTKTIEKI
jgi:SWI/SNF-related matrix-associated actin-dependent regulator 1 of chromatin subfamily A